MERLKQDFKNDLIAGLLVVIPLATTIWLSTTIARWVFTFLTRVPKQINPFNDINPLLGNLLNFLIGFAVPLFIIMLIGLMARNIAGQWLLNLGERTLQAIPFAGSLYKTLKQLLETLFRDTQDRFRRVVMLEYPRKGVWAIAFVTGTVGSSFQDHLETPMLSLFIPTTPNPTTGWYVIVAENEVIDTNMSVEDAFKVLISGGIVAPQGGHGNSNGRSFTSGAQTTRTGVTASEDATATPNAMETARDLATEVTLEINPEAPATTSGLTTERNPVPGGAPDRSPHSSQPDTSYSSDPNSTIAPIPDSNRHIPHPLVTDLISSDASNHHPSGTPLSSHTTDSDSTPTSPIDPTPIHNGSRNDGSISHSPIRNSPSSHSPSSNDPSSNRAINNSVARNNPMGDSPTSDSLIHNSPSSNSSTHRPSTHSSDPASGQRQPSNGIILNGVTLTTPNSAPNAVPSIAINPPRTTNPSIASPLPLPPPDRS
ncbi:MAG: DUF502 domain-containing protein [Prochlorothrix sp.]|nr:DUF502 domain-containing protein [Prochlorothrix sp.]